MKRVAVITTIYRYLSHAQHEADRLLVGYPYGGKWVKPDVKIVSLYVDQHPEGDLSQARAKEFGFTVYPTIAEALRCGGDKLAVDAVMIIGEYGEYPRNEKEQILYPRYEFFKQCVDVFEKDGRVVPIYNDKHLSYSFEKAKWMVDASKRLKFPMLAGSSLPVTWRLPDIELPLGCEIEDALMVGEGGSDPMDYHALDAMQCMVERRKGGETGVEWLQAYRGDNFWKAHEQEVWSPVLFKAALCRSHMLRPGRESFTHVYPTLAEMKGLAKDPVAYHYRHSDGLRSTIMLLNGLLGDFNFAAAIEGRARPFSTQMYASRESLGATLENYFSPLVHHIEQMMLTGKESYPAERTLLTTGLLCAGIDSLFQGQQRIRTPHLAVRYQPGESTFESA